MNAGTACHFPEDLLENYAMGRLSDHEGAPVEEHLLVCQTCQESLTELDEFLSVTRTALATVQTPPPLPVRRIPAQSVLAACIAAVLLIFVLPAVRKPDKSKQVSLAATRDASTFPQVHNGDRVRLKIDVTQIPQADGYQLEVVDGNGQPLWHAAVDAVDHQVVVTVPKHLAPGRYWVRLYDTGSPWTLLREFGLDVE